MSDIGAINDGFEDADREIEKDRALRLVEADETADKLAAIRQETDIVKRAGMLFRAQQITFKDVKKVRSGDAFITQPMQTDENKWAVLQALFDGEAKRPHNDEFRGRIVDHNGVVIDDRYPVVKWVEAFSAGGLKGIGAKSAREAIKEWAADTKRNDLIEYVKSRLPEFDGVPRVRRMLVNSLACRDTTLNEDASEYFFLSLYNRVMNPGCDASIVICLFGAQHSGKSYLQKRICRLLTGNDNADTVRLNLELKDAGTKDFLRKITGNSVIASGSEMTGFTRGDMSNIKDFVARTSDVLDFKYESHIEQQRQWIIVNDGNEYHGLQRDKTGNRRFYPMFVGQLDDIDGQPRWRKSGYKAPFLSGLKQFDEDFWQIMAECADWIKREGQEGYQRMVDSFAAKVTKFNRYEMDNMRGTTKNNVLEIHLAPVLEKMLKCTDEEEYGIKRTRYYDGAAYPNGVMVSAALFGELYRKSAEEKGVTYGHLDAIVKTFGAKIVTGKSNKKFYIFTAFKSIEEMAAQLKSDEGLERVEVLSDDDEEDGEAF